MDPQDLRADIPALSDGIYLNTGASCPSPTRVVDAASGFLERHEYDSPNAEGMYPCAYETIEDARATVAEFLGATPEELAFTNSTADAISRIATAIDWNDGDTVVRTDLEHPAGTLPWDRLEDVAGIEVRVLETEEGRLDLDAVAEVVEDARLLCLSSLSWKYGTRLPIGEVVEIAHEADTQVIVDAVQSPGQVPVDVSEWGADFVAGAGHKWLLGLWGAGFLYVRDGAEETLELPRIGYRGVKEPDADGRYELREGARRLEIGTRSPAPIVGLEEAVSIVEALGIDAIQEQIATVTDRLKVGIDDDRLLSPREYESGLVTIDDPEPDATVERLADEGIVIRSLPDPAAIRVSVHAFNTTDDVDRLLEVL
jgi:selenocysteine lyase/cysteine desulfurase